jgi:hypothetical protein
VAWKSDPALRFGVPIVISAFLGLAVGRYLYLQPHGVGRAPELSAVGAPAPDAAPLPPSSGEAARSAAAAGKSSAALPPLDQSDPLVRDLVGQLSSHPTVAAWLATDELVRGVAGSVANVALGDSPAPFMGPLAPREEFSVSKTQSGFSIHPRSYRRYDRFADAFTSLDVEGTVQLYARLRPLLARRGAKTLPAHGAVEREAHPEQTARAGSGPGHSQGPASLHPGQHRRGRRGAGALTGHAG